MTERNHNPGCRMTGGGGTLPGRFGFGISDFFRSSRIRGLNFRWPDPGLASAIVPLTLLILAALLFTAGAHAAESIPAAPLPLLTNAQQILALGVEGARHSPHPVKLNGVVTYTVFNGAWFYVQDETDGVLVVLSNATFHTTAGQRVEVVGRAGPGEFAAHVFEAEVRVLDTAPFPEPHRADHARLAAGADFGRWVVLEGRVADVFLHPRQLSLLIASGDRRFITNVQLDTPMLLPTSWLGARVEVRGVCWTITSATGKPVGFRIQSPGTNTIRFLEAGDPNIFARPLLTAKTLQSAPLPPDARVRVVGTVTLFQAPQQLFLQDETGPVQARVLTPLASGRYRHSVNPLNLLLFTANELRTTDHAHLVPLQPGDRVELVGTRLASALVPTLVDAEYRLLGRGPSPAPESIKLTDLHYGGHDGRLVTFRARLLDRVTRQLGSAGLDLLMLESDGKPCQATLTADSTNTLAAFELGSLLQLTGVNTAEVGEGETIRTVTLLLRDASDVRVVGRPVPWAAWPVGRILGGAVVLTFAGLAWVGLLRRRVAQRTAALAASEAHTRMIIDTALDAVVTMDVEGKVCGWSAQAEKIFGWTRAAAMGRTVAELIIPERYREAHERGLKHLLATGQGAVVNRRIEISALRKDGPEFPVELSIVAMKANGAWNFSAFARDLSERKQAETAIAEGEARMKTVLAHAPEAIMAFDADTGRFIEANENTVRLFGISREEILQIGPGEVSPPIQPNGRASAEMAREKVGEALAGGAPVFEWTHRNASGTEIPCEVRLARLPAAGRNLCIGTVTDITERKRAEAAVLASEARLRESEEQFRRAFRATPALISLVRLRDHRFVEVNETFVEVSGYAKEEIIGRTALELGFWPDPAHRTEFVRVLERDGSVHEFECGFRMKSRRLLRLLLSAERIELQGEPCILAMSVDITERKRAEAELHNALAREKELGELKSNFISMVSHEFRTPLGIIMSATENLENYFDRFQPTERAELLADIRTSTQRMSGLMQEVLLLARVDAGKLACKPVLLDLRVFLARLIEEVRSASEHACVIELDVTSETIAARADEALLRHTFTNLLSNAVKYSPLGQPVCFRVERDGTAVVFTVRDQGIGISEGDQKQLFQTFHRGGNVGERPGTGLGLVIVKRCVDLHGGTLRLESQVNAGTTVTVRLPLFANPVSTDLGAEVKLNPAPHEGGTTSP